MSNRKSNLFAVILAGGRGERFWPESRRLTPKQFLKIVGDLSLLETTVRRIESQIPMQNLLVVTTEELGHLVREHLSDLPESNVLLEPMGRNTAVALAYAAATIYSTDPDSTMVALPADHSIPDERKFMETLGVARDVAESGFLVTFGIVPTRPETGYGYIEVSDELLQGGKIPAYRASAFKEKPNLKLALEFVKSKKYLWNSGMFVWKTSEIMESFREHMPSLYEGIEELSGVFNTGGSTGAIRKFYSEAESISIDYGVMERAGNVAVVRADFDWDDVGSWLALDRLREKDDAGNVVVGSSLAIDAKNCILYSRDGLVSAIGVENLIVIRVADATLVCRKDRAQDVKRLVSALSEHGFEKYL